MGCNCNMTTCKTCLEKSLGVAQTQSNMTNVIGVPGPSIFEYEKQIGKIPEDMTYDEWRDLPVNQSNNIVEFGDNA